MTPPGPARPPTSAAPAALHVIADEVVGDPVTATALVVRERLTTEGWTGRELSATAPPGEAVEALASLPVDAPIVVHTVDGGEGLEPLLALLAGRSLTVVHHGSAPGSDRTALRSLRAHTRRAVAAEPAGREELRGLGFGEVGDLGPDALAALVATSAASVTGATSAEASATVPGEAAAAGEADHPGPRLLVTGRLGPERRLEPLLEAFAELVLHDRPDAVLSLCGPIAPWYHDRLERWIATRGLLSCELLVPRHEREVAERLDTAAVLVARPCRALDPHLWRAAARGIPVVGPTGPAAPPSLVPVPPTAGVAALREALDRALAGVGRPPAAAPPPAAGAGSSPVGGRPLSVALGWR